MTLDSPQACVAELAQVNQEIAEFGHQWAEAAGELKRVTIEYERRHRAALRGMAGHDLKVAEKSAAAHAAVEATAEGLAERIEHLEGQVEQFKVAFKALERRASNAQSVLAALKAESKMSDQVWGSWGKAA